MLKKALITGITGQDGSYLAEFLLEKGYEVFGLVRRTSNSNLNNIQHILDKIKIIPGDLQDQSSLDNAIRKSNPDEVYNLAAQSFVTHSWDTPIYTGDITGLGVSRVLEAIKLIKKEAKFYQASSSEIFGNTKESPQNENTLPCPRSPYGAAKVYGHEITQVYRDSYKMFCCSGILFNHESPRRGGEFVTRKITKRISEIKLGLEEELTLGNMYSKRDWGFAGDYVEAMWLMLQQEKSDNYVIATGETHSVKDFVNASFKVLRFDIEWTGEKENEIGRDKKTGNVIVRVSPELYRPAEVDYLRGDANKAERMLGWKPKINFEGLVEMMVKTDYDRLSNGIPTRII